MARSFTRGEVAYACVPYNEEPSNSKRRPVVILARSPMTCEDDRVVLVVPLTNFGEGGEAKKGDVPILNWRSLGLDKASWVRARRLWGAHPTALEEFRANGNSVVLDDMTLQRVLGEINDLF